MNKIICPDCGSENNDNLLICEKCSANLILNNKYKLRKILGENIGITYFAENINLQNYSMEDELKRTVKLYTNKINETNQNGVVIKELSLRTLEKWRNQELFRRESEILSQLNHEFVPKLIEEFELGIGRNAKSYIVMEYIDGITLREEFKTKRYNEKEVISMIIEIASIIDYLHSLRPPIIHRDLKLSNIMRKKDGNLVIIDFGSVKNLNMSKNATVSGTYGFMAPEQFSGNAGLESDYYSLGVIAVVLLSRTEPEDMIENALELKWREFVYANNNLLYLLERLLEPNPKNRLKSFKEIKDILNGKMKDEYNNDQTSSKNTNNNSASIGVNIFKEEFKRIDAEYSSISEESNYKKWKGNFDAILGFGMIGTAIAGWYYQTWYWGLGFGLVFVIVFMLMTGSLYKRKARKFLRLLISKIDDKKNRELMLMVLESWALKHDLGDEFLEELSKYTKKEAENKKLDLKLLREYKTSLNEDYAYEKFTKGYMEEFHKNE